MLKRTRTPTKTLESNLKGVASQVTSSAEYDGSITQMISTGSTLLDLAISGGRVKGGGLPAGILVEIFGPSGSGKTVLLSEIAGSVQRQGGQVMFHDPEARLNKQFAQIFGLNTEKMTLHMPDTVPEVFSAVRAWKPQPQGSIHGIFADSLAALSTELEMGKEEGDKMGMRRAKEFSEELRKTARIITKNNYLMVCSNQVRQNADAGMFGLKYKSPGGEAIGFYSSLRLRTSSPKKIKETVKVHGRDVIRVVGVHVDVEVFKSSVWKPFHIAPVTIIFDYGVDDIRENLQFLKTYTATTMYAIGETKLSVSMNKAISIVEEQKLERKLRREVIRVWEEIESNFDSNRKTKKR